MKNFKDFIYNVLESHTSYDDLKSIKYDTAYIKKFLSSFLIDTNDIDVFIRSGIDYKNHIDVYALTIDDKKFEGLGGLKSDYFEELKVDWDDLFNTLKKYNFSNIHDANAFWVNSGNGLRTIVIDIFDGKRSILNIIGGDDLTRVISELKKFKFDPIPSNESI